MNWNSNKEKPDNGCECLIVIFEKEAHHRLMFGEYWDDIDMFVECSDSASCWKREQVLAWVEQREILRDLRCFLHFCNWQPLEFYDDILKNKEFWK